MNNTHTYPKFSKTIVLFFALTVLTSSGLLLALVSGQRAQDIRPEATVAQGIAQVRFSPQSTTLPVGSHSVPVLIYLGTSNPKIDGIQLNLLLQGSIENVQFTPNAPTGLTLQLQRLTQPNPTEHQVMLAFLTSNPLQPFQGGVADFSIGTLTFTVLQPGTVELQVEPLLSKIVETDTHTDLLAPSAPMHLTFTSPSTPTATPAIRVSPTPIPQQTATPRPSKRKGPNKPPKNDVTE
jgi:hypothetical protein